MARLFALLVPLRRFFAVLAAMPRAVVRVVLDRSRRPKILREAGFGAAGLLAATIAYGVFAGDPNLGSPTLIVSLAEEDAAHLEPNGISAAHGPSSGQAHGLVEQGPFGPLPRIASDGRSPAREFSRPSPAVDGRPIVSILVTGLGRKAKETEEALKILPPDISLAFDPYSDNLSRLTGEARRKGHEYFLEIPVEPFDFPANDPGPLSLNVNGDAEENKNRLYVTLARMTGYAGLSVSGRSRFATDEPSVVGLLTEAKTRGLLLFDDAASPVSKIPRLGRQNQVQWGIADRRLDLRPTDEGIALQLLEIERLALEKGQAVGATDAFPLALSRLESWAKSLPSKGLVLVPISTQMINDTPQGLTSAIATPASAHSPAQKAPPTHSAAPSGHSSAESAHSQSHDTKETEKHEPAKNAHH